MQQNCDYCNDSFTGELRLFDHYRKDHPSHKFDFQCTKCDQSFAFQQSCKLHMKSIHQIKKPKIVRNNPKKTVTILSEKNGKIIRVRKKVKCDVCGISVLHKKQHEQSQTHINLINQLSSTNIETETRRIRTDNIIVSNNESTFEVKKEQRPDRQSIGIKHELINTNEDISVDHHEQFTNNENINENHLEHDSDIKHQLLKEKLENAKLRLELFEAKQFVQYPRPSKKPKIRKGNPGNFPCFTIDDD